jgi:hypothetical protein
MKKSSIKKKKTISYRYFSPLVFVLIFFFPLNSFSEFLNWKEREKSFYKSNKNWSDKEMQKESQFFKMNKNFFVNNDKWFEKNKKWHKKDALWIEQDRKPLSE